MEVYVFVDGGDYPYPWVYDTYEKALATAERMVEKDKEYGAECEVELCTPDEEEEYPHLLWECKVFSPEEEGKDRLWIEHYTIYKTEVE